MTHHRGRFPQLVLAVACSLGICVAQAASSAPPTGHPLAGESFSRPAGGEIQSHPFRYESARLREGILKIRQGEDFFADLEVTLFLFLPKGLVPEGQSWNIDCRGSWSQGTPHVHVAWREEGDKHPHHESVTCDYQLWLEFGQESSAGLLPGCIGLNVPELGTRVVGCFDATVEGFRVKNGEVDLTKDDLDVAEVVALRWLEAKVGKPVELVDRGLGWIHTEAPKGRSQAGYSVYWWRTRGFEKTRATKLQFEKRSGVWQVAHEVPLWRVAAANPNSMRQDLMASLDRRAARQFQTDHLATRGKTPVFVAQVRSSYNPVSGLAETVIRYALDEAKARNLDRLFGDTESGLTARYLFRTEAKHPGYKNPDAWHLERRLRPGELVDFKTGSVGVPSSARPLGGS